MKGLIVVNYHAQIAGSAILKPFTSMMVKERFKVYILAEILLIVSLELSFVVFLSSKYLAVTLHFSASKYFEVLQRKL